jgi:hypothetical protein
MNVVTLWVHITHTCELWLKSFKSKIITLERSFQCYILGFNQRSFDPFVSWALKFKNQFGAKIIPPSYFLCSMMFNEASSLFLPKTKA